MATMTIAGLARAGGVGVETVRYYQRRGLLPAPARAPGPGLGAGVRRYGPAEVARLGFIRSAQLAGFTLEEIGELLRLDADRDRARVRDLAAARLHRLDQHLAELGKARDWLEHLRQECLEDRRGPCPILRAFGRPADAGPDAPVSASVARDA